jgi:hypothetical protein
VKACILACFSNYGYRKIITLLVIPSGGPNGWVRVGLGMTPEFDKDPVDIDKLLDEFAKQPTQEFKVF